MLKTENRSKKLRVLVGPSSFAAFDKEPLNRLVNAGYEVINNPYSRKLTKEELEELLPGVSGLIAGLEPLTKEVLEKSELRVISRCGAGLSNIDLEAAKRLGIKVLYTPDAPATSVAELTIGAMISTIRKIQQMNHELHQGRWIRKTGYLLEGKTVAIIGFGRIGRKVARLLKGFKVRIIAVDPALSGMIDGVQVVSLSEALPQADVITVHAAGEDVIIGEKEFALIKPGAFLLNAGRGGLVSELYLCKALDNGLIAGAWFDTFIDEPYNGPLTQYPQVILTPHIGSYTMECRRQMEMQAVENLLAAFNEE